MRSRASRLAVGLTVGCLAGALLTFGLAGAANRVHSNAKLSPAGIKPDGVTAKVSSSLEACEKNRKAKLFYTAPGAARGEAMLVGKDKSNKKGKFEFDGSFFIGHYRVLVAGKSLSAKGAKGKLEDEPEAMDDDEGVDEKGGPYCSTTSSTSDE